MELRQGKESYSLEVSVYKDKSSDRGVQALVGLD